MHLVLLESPRFCQVLMTHFNTCSKSKDPSYQLFLDGEDPVASSFTVCSLARDDNCFRIAVLRREINLGVTFLTDLQQNTL